MEIPVAAEIEHYLFEPENTDLPQFVVLEFIGHEGISRLSHFGIKLLSTNQDIAFSDILNKRASLRIWCWQDSDYGRVYHGIISSFELIGQDDDYTLYRAELVPHLWRLTMNYQSRIFQNMPVPEIIREVLDGAGLQGYYDFNLQGEYPSLIDPPREFCVQYRETDFNFISRLMEDEGIFYFFKHEVDAPGEIMVIADRASIHEDTSPLSEVRFESDTGLPPDEEEFIHSVRYKASVIPINYALKDFNYDTPQTDLTSRHITIYDTQDTDRDSFETHDDGFSYYDYPGHFGFVNRGSSLAVTRYEEREVERRIISGEGNCRSFCAGYRFTLLEAPRAGLEGQLLLTRVEHHGIQGGPLATEAQISYENRFECLPQGVDYRPPRVTPKARVQGTQTATVVGDGRVGREVYMDEKGRAKIQFHWDLEGTKDENSSCWVRVGYFYAGQNHGAQFPPLIGDEVIVDFLEGDPDKPIIIGCVYNNENTPPLVPEDRIQNIIKTPYQHHLLFDDNKQKIRIKTGGDEKIVLTDNDEEFGNNILIRTSNGHFISLENGTDIRNAIRIGTEAGNYVILHDSEELILMRTTGRHLVLLNDAENQITIETAGGHLIKLDDPSGTITISGTGTVAITAGTVTIDADDIIANASNNITLESGGNIEINASGDLNMTATNITATASAKAEITASTVTTDGTMNEVKGGTVVIQGTPVKIN